MNGVCDNLPFAVSVPFMILGLALSKVNREGSQVSLSSYSDVFAISHDRGYDEEISVGDVVRMNQNFHPHYTVIALSGDKAWVRNVQNGADSLAELRRCRKLGAQDAGAAVAIAAE